MKKIVLLITIANLIIAISIKAQEKGSFKDSRDGKTYKTVKICKQTWMAENLNFTTSSGSWCYDDKKDNCEKYGKLYDWETAKAVCPKGWHLPSKAEWKQLVDNLGGINIAGGKMKKTGITLWTSPNTGASNKSGFSAIPGGSRGNVGTFYSNIGKYTTWWSSTEGTNGNENNAEIWELSYNKSNVGNPLGAKFMGYSVRCVKD